jgi:hypothetical protein
MDELVTLVSDKTGLSEEKARIAVRTVVGYLEVKLPPPVAGQIRSVLGGAGAPRVRAGVSEGLGDVGGEN